MIVTRWAGIAALIAAAVGIGISVGNAALAQPKAGTVIAQSEISTTDPLQVAADAPRAISVQGAGGRAVTFTPPKGRPVVVTSSASTPTVARDLTAGRQYSISIGGRRIGMAVPVTSVARPTALRVMAGATPGSASLTWSHATRPSQGGVVFEVTVVPVSGPGPRITLLVPGHSATITGLDPAARYAFHVFARNSASRSSAVIATMSSPLLAVVARPAELHTTSPAPTVVTPSATPPLQPAPVAVQAPVAAAPAPAAPAMRTVWSCPEGAVLLGTTCTTTREYTYRTETNAYTFHTESMAYTTHQETRSGGPCSYLPNPNSPSGLDIYCPTYTVDVRDATPTGWTDNGQAWTRQVRDATPTGWSDTGTTWTRQVRDDAPIGFVDTGSEWRRVEAAASHQVPA